MQLFDPSKQNPARLSPALHTENTFAFLEETSDPRFNESKDRLASWFDQYPNDMKAELKSRIEAKSGFDGVVFELFLHSYFLKLGAILQVHPTIPGGNRNHPDFLVTLSCGTKFYLEATIVTGEGRDTEIASRRLHSMYDYINQNLFSSDFNLHIEVLQYGTKNLPLKRLVADLSKFIARTERQEIRGDDGYTVWEENDWSILFNLLARTKPQRREKGDQIIGAYPTITAVSSADIELRNAIEKKCKQHRNLDHPLLVAVNALQPDADLDSFLDAVYGKCVYRFQHYRGEVVSEGLTRADNGIWLRRAEHSKQRLAGVLAFCHFTAFSSRVRPTILESPFSSLLKGLHLGPVSRYTRIGDEMKLIPAD